jgi:hypothetical protein
LAKALKFAALAVGAVALIATGVGAVALGGLAGSLTVAGVSTGTLFLASGGLTLAASLLQKGPKVTASQTDRLTASIDPRTFRKTVLGQTAMPVDVRYEEWSGKDQEICDWIVAFASHAIDGLEEIWFDTEMAWSATTGVVAKYNGYFSIPNLILEGTPQNAFTFGQWNRASARLTGCAYARFRFKVTGNSKKAESPFSSGIPSRITVIGRGAKLYDPRRDSTVPGGSGPMRADDQSTWRFKTDDGVVIGENLPLQILRVILGWRIRNPASGVMKLATGAGVPMRRISLPSFQVAANLADELVNRGAGGNEPRYHGAGVISEGDDHKTVLDMLCTACCGRFRDTGGKLSLSISHNDLATAALDDGLNDDDVVGAFTWDPDPSLETTPNVVRGRYVDATSASLYQLIDYPEVRLPSPDGQDRYLSLDLGVVESPSHAQRVAKQVLQRRQYARQFAAPFDIRAWKYTVGDVLPFTFAPLGFNRGVFRVKEQELGQGGTCNMVLTFETPAFYQWDADDSLPVQGAEPIVYDSRNNPLILAIDEAATTAFWDGVTGDGKPADDATNSADPNSPFGPGTVGGTINQISEFDRQIAVFRGQLTEIDGVTLPAINQAVLYVNSRVDEAKASADRGIADANTAIGAAGDRITTTKQATDKALADAVALLSDSDAKINTRIDSIAAEGGYDDTYVRSEIKRVDETAVSRDGTLGRRIDSVITDYKAGDVATNGRIEQAATTASDAKKAVSDLSTSVDASFKGVTSTLTSYNERISGLATDALGYAGRTTSLETRVGNTSNYATANASFSAWPDGAATPSQWVTWNAGTFTRANSQFQAGAYTARQNAVVGVNSGMTTPFFITAGYWVIELSVWIASGTAQGAGAYIDNLAKLDCATYPDNNGTVGAGGTGIRHWSMLVLSTVVGPVNLYALGNWSELGNTTTKTIEFLKCGARPAAEGEIKALKADSALPLVTARVKLTEDTLADLPNRYAAATRTALLEAQVQGDGGSRLLSRASDQATVIADAKVGAVSQRIDGIDADYRAADVTTNGRIDQVATTASDAKKAVSDLSTSVDASFKGVNLTLTNFNERITSLATDAQGYVGRTTSLETRVGNTSSYATANASFTAWPDGAATPSQWAIWNAGTFTRANSQFQAGAYTARQNAVVGVNSGMTTPFFITAGYWVIELSVWIASGTAQGAGAYIDNLAKLDCATYPDNNGTVGAGGTGIRHWSMLVLSTVVGPVNLYALGNWSELGNTTTKTIEFLKCGARPAAEGEIKALKADSALPLVTARVKLTEDTLADLPNRYAAATRTALLEAQVQGDSGSRLLSRASDQATVIADAKAGAVAQDLSILRAEYNGTYGEVNRQAGVLAGVDGRTSVYWRVTGTTPDGSATVQLSKADGTPGLFYIGANLLVDGNAIFNGTVTIKALDRSTMTATSSGSVSGSYGGAGQAAFAYIPNLGADMAIRSGGSIYLTFTGNIAATTDASGSIYASFEILNAANNSLLASVRLPTPGFGPSGRLDNFVIRILNVWGDLTIRWRVANRATSNTWSIVQNPQCSVYWTAL